MNPREAREGAVEEELTREEFERMLKEDWERFKQETLPDLKNLSPEELAKKYQPIEPEWFRRLQKGEKAEPLPREMEDFVYGTVYRNPNPEALKTLKEVSGAQEITDREKIKEIYGEDISHCPGPGGKGEQKFHWIYQTEIPGVFLRVKNEDSEPGTRQRIPWLDYKKPTPEEVEEGEE